MYVQITDDQFSTLKKLWIYLKEFNLDKYLSDKIKIHKETDKTMDKLRNIISKIWQRYYYVNYIWEVYYWYHSSVSVSKYSWELKLSYDWSQNNLYDTEEEAREAAIPIKQQYQEKLWMEKIQRSILSRTSQAQITIDEALKKQYITEEEYKVFEKNNKNNIFIPILGNAK